MWRLKNKPALLYPARNSGTRIAYFISIWCNSRKTELMIVADGGNCHFNFTINLMTKIFYDLSVNGETLQNLYQEFILPDCLTAFTIKYNTINPANAPNPINDNLVSFISKLIATKE